MTNSYNYWSLEILGMKLSKTVKYISMIMELGI